jgi:hypothetical protein
MNLSCHLPFISVPAGLYIFEYIFAAFRDGISADSRGIGKPQ